RLKGDYASAWVNLGLCYENLGYHKQAAKMISKYIENAPNDAPDIEFMNERVKELENEKDKPTLILPDSLLNIN
ncbi:MAG: hypothetical protein ACPL6C_01365, partial [bacterium]